MRVSAFTTAIRWAAAGIESVPGQLEPQAAVWWQRAAGRLAFWEAWMKNKDASAQHMFNERASQKDDQHHSPHDCLEQQSSVLLISTSPSLVQSTGSGRGQMIGLH